jgi:hypothetical protein
VARTFRFWLSLVLGLVMIAIGAYVAARPLWTPLPVTGSRVLDMAFAALFLLRGFMNLRVIRRTATPRFQGPNHGGPGGHGGP